jgi:hypothetical protein
LADFHPHFNFHVQVLIDSVYFDPSYGTTGKAQALHVCDAPNVTFREAQDFPVVPSTCNWLDPHPLDAGAPGCP